MRYAALAADYDGTLATDGRVDAATLAALAQWRRTGRKLFLVTGRQLDDLAAAFPEYRRCDRLVVENGAVLYNPAAEEELILARPLPREFTQALRNRGVQPLAVGRVVVATWQPHELAVLEAIRDQRVDAQVIFNKRAVMVLPTGINKATGLRAALSECRLLPHQVAAVGDAENDLPLFDLCGCSAAVANALPQVKRHADFVCARDHGAGVAEWIEHLLAGEGEGD